MSQNFTIFDRSAPRVLYQQAWISVDLASENQLPRVLRIARAPDNPLVGTRDEPNSGELPCGRRDGELRTASSTTQHRAGCRESQLPKVQLNSKARSPNEFGIFLRWHRPCIRR